MNVYEADVRRHEVEAKKQVEIARVQADLQKVAAEAQAKEAILKAETELIKTRGQHADVEMLVLSERRAIEQIRAQAQLKMVGLFCAAMIVLVAMVRAC